MEEYFSVGQDPRGGARAALHLTPCRAAPGGFPSTQIERGKTDHRSVEG